MNFADVLAHFRPRRWPHPGLRVGAHVVAFVDYGKQEAGLIAIGNRKLYPWVRVSFAKLFTLQKTYP
jgi:hypothetical protein